MRERKLNYLTDCLIRYGHLTPAEAAAVAPKIQRAFLRALLDDGSITVEGQFTVHKRQHNPLGPAVQKTLVIEPLPQLSEFLRERK